MKAFDLETIKNKDLLCSLPEPEVKFGNTKDPEKRRVMIEEAKVTQVEKMGLSPITGRICSFSFHGDNESMFEVIPEATDAAEIELINHIFEHFVIETSTISREESKIITWNGFNFDFPYVYKRAAMLRVELPAGCPGLKYWTHRYSNDVHCDLMQELSGWNIGDSISINYAGLSFLGRGKTKRDYETYVDLIESGQGDLIGLDNLCDTTLTYDLYQLLSTYLF